MPKTVNKFNVIELHSGKWLFMANLILFTFYHNKN